MRRNVVYINWDGFAWYYYKLSKTFKHKITPVIDGLIEQGVLFTDAYTGIPSITNPMQSAIVSGAWPAVTGNCYRYYDKKSRRVIQLKRDNKAENIAEAAVRQGLSIASLHQFIFENRGTIAGDGRKPYIQTGRHTDCRARFNAAVSLAKGKAAGKGPGRIRLDEFPAFFAMYMDDLDAAGHNCMPIRAPTERARLGKIMKRLHLMDRKLGEFIQACRESGIYDGTAFILTSDHGMAPFGRQGLRPDGYERSKLPDLIDSINGLGYKTQTLSAGETPDDDTDIVIVTAGLEVQLSFTGAFDGNDIEMITYGIGDKAYVGQIMKREEMRERGAMEEFADLLISPEAPYCLSTGERRFRAGGQHDSLDETAQHIFSLMWGSGIKKGYTYHDRIYNIDFARTMTRLLGIDGPRDATGQVLDDALTD